MHITWLNYPIQRLEEYWRDARMKEKGKKIQFPIVLYWLLCGCHLLVHLCKKLSVLYSILPLGGHCTAKYTVKQQFVFCFFYGGWVHSKYQRLIKTTIKCHILQYLQPFLPRWNLVCCFFYLFRLNHTCCSTITITIIT